MTTGIDFLIRSATGYRFRRRYAVDPAVWSSVVARKIHDLEAVGSNPTTATGMWLRGRALGLGPRGREFKSLHPDAWLTCHTMAGIRQDLSPVV